MKVKIIYFFICRLIVVILFFTTISAYAQSKFVHISGKVSDKITNTALSNVKIYIIDLDDGSTDSTISDFSGFWGYDLEATSFKDNQKQNSAFSVTQNYPNPFYSSTEIEFTVKKAGVVKVSIFNILGEMIDSNNEFLTEGAYCIEWDARAGTGIYFINVRSKNRSITKKITLLGDGHGNGLSGFRPGSGISQSIQLRIQTSKFGYVPYSVETGIDGGEFFDFKIVTIHSAGIVADLHNDILEKMIEDTTYHLADYHSKNHTDIPRLIMGGVDIQCFVVWVNPYTHAHDSYSHALAMIDIFNSELSINFNSMGQARTKTEALLLHNNNRIAAVLVVEGGHAIENDIKKLRSLYQAGMRYLTITWNNSTDWAVSAQDGRSATVGLSEFGKKVIRTLDTLGVIIDVSHTGIKTIQDILSITPNPVIASHSGVRSLRDHYRNLYDNQIISIANSGGVIGVVFYPPYLSNTGTADIAGVADHIDYIVNLVRIDYVGLGDFDGIGTNTVQGLDDVTKFPDLTLELLRREYSQTDVEKILGGNFIRVFEQVCGE